MFEGIRCYDTPRGPAVVHLDGHLQRLLDSCKMYRIDVQYSREDLAAACFEVVRANGLSSCYIRPMVLRGYGAAGMDGIGSPIETYVPAWEWGAYLGEATFATGIDCGTASWARPSPNTFPGMAKAAGNYNNAALIKMEAQANGFAEAIALDASTGMVSEGSGQNIFVVKDGEIITPPINGSNLSGLTRRSVLQLAAAAGIPCRVEPIPRELLYVADELFFSGTATEVMPIRSLDHIKIGPAAHVGARGPVTELVQRRYQDIINGRADDEFGWLSYGD
jgi:branched-chain amino acid aminotransferase